jgi:hypothetical protein
MAVGKLADLIVVGANPLQDITNVRRLQLVLKEGRVVSDKRHLTGAAYDRKVAAFGRAALRQVPRAVRIALLTATVSKRPFKGGKINRVQSGSPRRAPNRRS